MKGSGGILLVEPRRLLEGLSGGVEGKGGIKDDLKFLTCTTGWIGVPFAERGDGRGGREWKLGFTLRFSLLPEVIETRECFELGNSVIRVAVSEADLTAWCRMD